MKVKLGQIVNSQTALQDLGSKQLIAKSAFQIRRVLKVVGEQLEIYQVTHTDLIKKHGVQQGESWTVPPEKFPAFYAELNPLLESEIELTIDKLPFSTIEDVKISGGNLLLLEWLIDDPKPDIPQEGGTK